MQFWIPILVPARSIFEIAGLRHFLPRRHFLSICFKHVVHFVPPFFCIVFVPWGSLGRPLDPKTCKNCRFFKVFEKALWSSWWPSWAHLGPFWLKTAPKSWSKMGCKTGLNRVKFMVCWGFEKISKELVLSFLVSFLSNFGINFGGNFGS